MADSVLLLLDQGYVGAIYALSRRGLLSRRHAFDGSWKSFLPDPFPTSVLQLTRLLRAEIERATGQGIGWQQGWRARCAH